MPEEKASGMLIPSLGSPVATLTQEESNALFACLRILRQGNTSRSYEALDAVIDASKELGEYPERLEFLQSQINSFLFEYEASGEGTDDHHGILARKNTGFLRTLDWDECLLLDDTLTAVRTIPWLNQWWTVQVASIAKGSHPDDRYPSPHKIAGSLVIEITEWNEIQETAKGFAERRPDLLFPAPPAEPEAATEPVASSKPAKAPSARKARKKAA